MFVTVGWAGGVVGVCVFLSFVFTALQNTMAVITTITANIGQPFADVCFVSCVLSGILIPSFLFERPVSYYFEMLIH